MEHKKILNLLNEASDSKFVTRKCNIANNQWNENYDVENEMIYNTKVLKSNLCDYSDTCILVRGNTAVQGAPITQVAFISYDHLISVSQKLMEL